VAEPAKVDCAGRVESFLRCAGVETGAQGGVLIAVVGGGVDRNTARYNQTARPFSWKYTAADLASTLDRISTYQQPASLPKAA
jgi:hypothetical protein